MRHEKITKRTTGYIFVLKAYLYKHVFAISVFSGASFDDRNMITPELFFKLNNNYCEHFKHQVSSILLADFVKSIGTMYNLLFSKDR